MVVISHGSLRIPNGSKNAHAYVHLLSLDLHFKICNVSWPKQGSPRSQSQRADGKTILLIGRIHNACLLSDFSHVQLFETLWTVACQPHLSMRFSRQEYWSGFPVPPPGDLPDPGVKPTSLVSPALAGRFLTTVPAGGITK